MFKLSAQQVATHNTFQDCWIVIEDQVWDVTHFVRQHPGGAGGEFISFHKFIFQTILSHPLLPLLIDPTMLRRE
jgi:hypothetical protein